LARLASFRFLLQRTNIQATIGLKDEEKRIFWYIWLAENHLKDWGVEA
jgi:hypothetical protein